MPATASRRPVAPAERALPAPADEVAPLAKYTLPVVATAFAAGVFLGTRPGRHLTRGVLRAGLLLVKPALIVGGLLKLREATNHPNPRLTPPTP